jgi:hypothetical protein
MSAEYILYSLINKQQTRIYLFYNERQKNDKYFNEILLIALRLVWMYRYKIEGINCLCQKLFVICLGYQNVQTKI